jgi:hypothetical protein
MALDHLLWLCLSINAVTLIFSFIILRKFKKITKLTTLIYDQLTSKVDSSSFEENEISQKARFEDQLTHHLNKVDHDLRQNTSPLSGDPLLENYRATQGESTVKTATRAESHLIKVLQGKYAQDEESFPPTGN